MGLFGNLFDFNHDGKMSTMEKQQNLLHLHPLWIIREKKMSWSWQV